MCLFVFSQDELSSKLSTLTIGTDRSHFIGRLIITLFIYFQKPKKSKRKHKKEKAVEQEIPATNSCEKKINEAKDAPIFEIEDGTDGTVAMETDEKNEEEGMIVDNPGGKDKNDKDEEEEEEELEDGELSESSEGSESESESSESPSG